MRIIKFRQWHPTKGMMQWENLVAEWFLEDFEKVNSGESVCSLMQFTGLHDKNGKEIYEGDIVKLVYIHDEGGGWRSKSKERGVVYFDPTWGVKFDCKDHTQRTADTHWKIKAGRFTDATDIVVIGNIYENPELLK